MKKTIALLLALSLMLALTACGSPNAEYDLETAQWDQILADAKGTRVTLSVADGDGSAIHWISTTLADYVKENYGVTLKVTDADEADILCVDAVSGEDSLYGPFTDKLPNLADDEAGSQVPYIKSQFVMYADTALVDPLPTSWQTLEALCQQYPGQVAYPNADDEAGMAFLCTIIYEVCGWKQFQDLEADYDAVKAAVEPAMEFLRGLNPLLRGSGRNFPESGDLEAMYADGEVVMAMSADPFAAAAEDFPETTQTFVFAKGTAGSADYMVIPTEASNKPGAMVVINAMLSAELQLDRYAQFQTLPVIDTARLSAEERAAFDAVDMGRGVLSRSELASHCLPDMPEELIPIIREIWQNEVVGK